MMIKTMHAICQQTHALQKVMGNQRMAGVESKDSKVGESLCWGK